MEENTPQNTNQPKIDLENNLIHYQNKLKKILKAEERLSLQSPSNTERLIKQAKAREKVSKEIEQACSFLIDMGASFPVRRKRSRLTTNEKKI